MTRVFRRGILPLFFCLALCSLPVRSNSPPLAFEIEITSDDEIAVSRYPVAGPVAGEGHLVILFAPEYGLRQAHGRFARLLSERGIEVWTVNLQESLFLPDSAATLRRIDPSPVTSLVDQACTQSGRRVVLAGDSYASVIALRGAHHWQQHGKADCLIGAALFSPYTMSSIPPLGHPPEYLPIISATNVPLLVYQTTDSAIFGEFPALLGELGRHGNPIYSAVVPDVMSLFYEDPPSRAMEAASLRVADLMAKTLPLLNGHAVPDLPPALEAPVLGDGGIDSRLRPFSGQVDPIPIRLKDTDGDVYFRDNFEGQVTLVNFWATWCPPCVEEIPSLNSLQKALGGEAFELVSINYAENNKVIREFMQSVAVDFTVLQDPLGEFSRQWRVISYPSSFIIDTRGKIRYGVNAAIHWNDLEVVETLRRMARE